MPFISYAQNSEDVLLWRALGHVSNGFYVDVGAWDPVQDSVTKALYDRGWRGINIEPIREWYEKLVAERPEDINLNVAILDRPGTAQFFEIAGTGLSTAIEENAERHQAQRGFGYRSVTVPALTLDDALRDRVPAEIHFLKIDVEGTEGRVLQGIDLKRTRPWIILVESTLPLSNEPDFAGWEPLLKSAGYGFVHFDGLNRFYLAKEHPELAAALAAPPNALDEFIRSSEWNTRQALEASNDERVKLLEAVEAKEAAWQAVSSALEAKERDRQKLDKELLGRTKDLQWHARALKEKEAEVAAVEAEKGRLQAEITRLETMMQGIDAVVQDLEAERTEIENERMALPHALDDVRGRLLQAEVDASGRLFALNEMYASVSWRVTAPLRALHARERAMRLLRLLVGVLRRRPGTNAALTRLRGQLPRLWWEVARTSHGTSETVTPLSATDLVIPPQIDVRALPEDEKRMAALFRREMSRRARIQTENKS